MYFDAFSAGVEPGGLRNTQDIGILICYMLTYINKPLYNEDLVKLIQINGIANYFEINAAISELIKNNNVQYCNDNKDLIKITKEGRLISHQLSSELSLSVRQKAVSALMKFNERRLIEKENPVTITKAECGGFNVNIRITDGIRDLMSLTLFVPDRTDANAVKRYFYEKPQRLYTVMLAAAVGEKNMIEQAIKELRNE